MAMNLDNLPTDTDDFDLPDTIDDLDPSDRPRSGYDVNTREDHSPLDALRAVLHEREAQTVRYAVPESVLPGDWSLEFSTRISTAELRSWQAKSRGKRRNDDVDPGKLNALVLANKNVAMFQGGKQVTDEDGDAMTLVSDDILSLTQRNTAVDAVRALLTDGYVTSLGDELVTAAGFGQDVAEDPTKASSSRG